MGKFVNFFSNYQNYPKIRNFFIFEGGASRIMEIPNALVVALGVGIVFIGLICIIILCKIMSAVCMMAQKNNNTTPTTSTATPVASAVMQPIQNRQEIIAAVSAVLAEELGTDVSAIRILSFKKI